MTREQLRQRRAAVQQKIEALQAERSVLQQQVGAAVLIGDDPSGPPPPDDFRSTVSRLDDQIDVYLLRLTAVEAALREATAAANLAAARLRGNQLVPLEQRKRNLAAQLDQLGQQTAAALKAGGKEPAGYREKSDELRAEIAAADEGIIALKAEIAAVEAS